VLDSRFRGYDIRFQIITRYKFAKTWEIDHNGTTPIQHLTFNIDNRQRSRLKT